MREGSPPLTCHMSRVISHISHFMCHVSHVIFLHNGEDIGGGLSMGPTLSSLIAPLVPKLWQCEVGVLSWIYKKLD